MRLTFMRTNAIVSLATHGDAPMSSTTLAAYANLFGTISGSGSVFIAPADEEAAREAFRALRIRVGDGHYYALNAYGICAPGNGVLGMFFYLNASAKWKLHQAGMIDPDRIIGDGR